MRRKQLTDGMRARPLPLALLLLLVALAAATSAAALAMLAPAVALLLLLLAGRAPGEELLLRWRRAVPRQRLRAVALRPHGARRPFAHALLGRIAASAFAMRPPPAAPALGLPT
jgi:hypothetical protein